MTITYRDDIGMVQVTVVGEIDFMGGEAYFDDGEQDYRIPIANILQIQKTEQ